jgi:predicted transcriptional regulator
MNQGRLSQRQYGGVAILAHGFPELSDEQIAGALGANLQAVHRVHRDLRRSTSPFNRHVGIEPKRATTTP